MYRTVGHDEEKMPAFKKDKRRKKERQQKRNSPTDATCERQYQKHIVPNEHQRYQKSLIDFGFSPFLFGFASIQSGVESFALWCETWGKRSLINRPISNQRRANIFEA